MVPSPYSAQTFAAKQHAQSVNGGKKIAAVLLHHRQEQIAPRVTAKTGVMFEGRQAREQDAARLAFVSCERQRAFQHIARRQHPQLVAQLAGAAAAVEHRHDGIEV